VSEPSFSQREGIIPISKKPQVKDMDLDLRYGLWNVVSKHHFRNIDDFFESYPKEKELYYALYHDFFKFAVDEIPEHIITARDRVRELFFELPYNRIYDLIEFLEKYHHKTRFTSECNNVLSKEFSGYVIVSGKVIHRISKQEISQIENALNNPVGSAKNHLNKSLSLLNREKPDYANSIKESISAVEAICRKVCGNPKLTLGKALNLIKKQGIINIHPALFEALDRLYGYTSSSGGIRHAAGNDPDVPQEDALFMLTTCSAFVNYLVVKAEMSQILLK
jgi:hypothetical protein